MTDATKKIVNYVYEAKGRFGKNIIIDTVVGGNYEGTKIYMKEGGKSVRAYHALWTAA